MDGKIRCMKRAAECCCCRQYQALTFLTLGASETSGAGAAVLVHSIHTGSIILTRRTFTLVHICQRKQYSKQWNKSSHFMHSERRYKGSQYYMITQIDYKSLKFYNMNILKAADIVELMTALFMFKARDNELPENHQILFNLCDPLTSCATRQQSKFIHRYSCTNSKSIYL